MFVRQTPAQKHLEHFFPRKQKGYQKHKKLLIHKTPRQIGQTRERKKKKKQVSVSLSFSLFGWLGLWILFKRHLTALRELGGERSENMALWLAVWVFLWRKARAATQIILRRKWGTIRVQREVSGWMKKCCAGRANWRRRRRRGKKGLFVLPVIAGVLNVIAAI